MSELERLLKRSVDSQERMLKAMIGQGSGDARPSMFRERDIDSAIDSAKAIEKLAKQIEDRERERREDERHAQSERELAAYRADFERRDHESRVRQALLVADVRLEVVRDDDGKRFKKGKGKKGKFVKKELTPLEIIAGWKKIDALEREYRRSKRRGADTILYNNC